MFALLAVGCFAEPLVPPAGIDGNQDSGASPSLDGHFDPGDAGENTVNPDLAPASNPKPNPGPMPDLAQPAPQPQPQPQPQLNGCNGAITCVNNCSTQACQDGCMQMTTASGQTKFNALLTCIDTACPGDFSFDPCYNATSTKCDTCVSNAQDTGGSCKSKLTACTNDTP